MWMVEQQIKKNNKNSEVSLWTRRCSLPSNEDDSFHNLFMRL